MITKNTTAKPWTWYELLWRNKWLTHDAKSIDDIIDFMRTAASNLEEMRDAGVTLDPDSDTDHDYARLVTTDAEVAKKFGFEETPEDWETEDGNEDEEDSDLGRCPLHMAQRAALQANGLAAINQLIDHGSLGIGRVLKPGVIYALRVVQAVPRGLGIDLWTEADLELVEEAPPEGACTTAA